MTATTPARADAIIPLVPGTLYRIGCVVAARDLTWMADSPGQYEALNCYLLRTADEAIFIDTGVKIAQPEITQAMATLIGDRSVSVFPTRNEFDCIGNLGHILGLREDVRLLFGGGGGILEWVNDPAVDEREVNSFLNRREIVLAANGTETGFADGTRFHWLDAPVKEMFLTQWAYEEHTKTLFTSDFFGWVHIGEGDTSLVVDRPEQLPALETLCAEIPRRMNWLPGANATEVLAAFDRVVAGFEVEIIAPVHGRAITGPAVRQSIDDARAALVALTDRSCTTESE